MIESEPIRNIEDRWPFDFNYAVRRVYEAINSDTGLSYAQQYAELDLGNRLFAELVVEVRWTAEGEVALRLSEAYQPSITDESLMGAQMLSAIIFDKNKPLAARNLAK